MGSRFASAWVVLWIASLSACSLDRDVPKQNDLPAVGDGGLDASIDGSTNAGNGGQNGHAGNGGHAGSSAQAGHSGQGSHAGSGSNPGACSPACEGDTPVCDEDRGECVTC